MSASEVLLHLCASFCPGMAAEVSSDTDDFDQTFALLSIVDARESLRVLYCVKKEEVLKTNDAPRMQQLS